MGGAGLCWVIESKFEKNKSYMITSSNPSEGKTTYAFNLALSFDLITNDQKLEYMKKRSEGMLLVDLLEMEKRLDNIIIEKGDE